MKLSEYRLAYEGLVLYSPEIPVVIDFVGFIELDDINIWYDRRIITLKDKHLISYLAYASPVGIKYIRIKTNE